MGALDYSLRTKNLPQLCDSEARPRNCFQGAEGIANLELGEN